MFISMSIKLKSSNHTSHGKTLTSVKSAQFLYQSSYSYIFQQIWNLFHTLKKEILNFENWIKMDRYRSGSYWWKMCNVDLVELWKNGSMKYFNFFIFFFTILSSQWIPFNISKLKLSNKQEQHHTLICFENEVIVIILPSSVPVG